MRFSAFLIFSLSVFALAVEQEQPTPYDLIRPIWPMKWDTSATDDGGTVESFSKYAPNLKKHNTVPPVGTMPQDFVANGIIPDTLNQAFRDAQNLCIGRIRIVLFQVRGVLAETFHRTTVIGSRSIPLHGPNRPNQVVRCRLHLFNRENGGNS